MDSAEKLLEKEIQKYPVLSSEEQQKLVEEYKKTGSKEIFDKLVNHNLRLCLKVARKYHSRVESMTFLDLFQECSIILMNAIELYDSERDVKLSTYAMKSMDNTIKQRIADTDKTIRKSVDMEIRISKYNQFINKYEQKYHKRPSKEEIQEELELNQEQLNRLEESLQVTTTSLDKQVTSDEDSSNLIDFIPAKGNEYQNIELDYDLNILKNKCREILTNEEYYIIYYRYISDEKRSLEQLGQEFLITRERIRQKEKSALIKLKSRLEFNKKTNNGNLEDLNPLSMDTIIVLNELKKKLSKEEYFILYWSIARDFTSRGESNHDYFQILGLSQDSLIEIKQYLLEIFKQYSSEKNITQLREKYHQRYTNAQILELDIKIGSKELIDFQELGEYFKSLDIEDIKNTSYYKSLSLQDQNLIKRCYQINNDSLNYYQKKQVEKEVTLDKFGYLEKEKPLYNKAQFQKLYIKYCDLLEETQRKNLRIILFPQEGETFIDQYKRQRSLNKLMRIDLRIDNFFHNKITEKHIKQVLEKYPKLLTEEEKEDIFKYYGIGQDRVDINTLAKERNSSYEKTHDRVFDLKDKLLFKYYHITEGKKEELEEDKKLYQSYMNNPQYEFSDNSRRIFKMYLSGKTYGEIAIKEKISKSKVSNIITEGIRKCEFYKYGIITPFLISEEDMRLIFEQGQYSEKQKKLLQERYLNSKMPKKLSKKYNLSTRSISSLNFKFYYEYLKLKCPKISISQYKEELGKHQADSILTEEEKQLVALKYGIQCKYNQKGEIKSNQELAKILSISVGFCKNKLDYLSYKMRQKLLGLRTPDYGLIPREEMKQILKDKNLPISEKERDIICHTNELEEYDYMTEKDLSIKYQEKPASIQRRYNRAVLAIKKYQEGLIPKQISYEADIKKIEKYFSEYDRNLLKMVYQQKLSEEKIAKILKISISQSRQKVIKLKLDVSEILNDEVTAKKFDFNYARKVLDKEDLPLYYADNEVAKKIYKMVTGEFGNPKLSFTEIIKQLALSDSYDNVRDVFYNVMIAIKKYKKGIRKTSSITNQEIVEFYQKTREELPKDLKKYIEKEYLNNPLADQRKVTKRLIYEILKQKGTDCVEISQIDINEAQKLVRNKQLTSSCRRHIKNYFCIPEREIMSGRDKLKVLKKLAPLYKKISVNKTYQK